MKFNIGCSQTGSRFVHGRDGFDLKVARGQNTRKKKQASKLGLTLIPLDATCLYRATKDSILDEQSGKNIIKLKINQ